MLVVCTVVAFSMLGISGWILVVVDESMIRLGLDTGDISVDGHPVTRFNNNSNLSFRALLSLSYLSSHWAQYSCSRALSATYFASSTNSSSSCRTLSASRARSSSCNRHALSSPYSCALLIVNYQYTSNDQRMSTLLCYALRPMC